MTDEVTDYESILKGSWDNIPDLKLLPPGTWRLKCRAAKFSPNKNPKVSPQIVFAYEPVEPMDDVDDEALAALGKNYNYSENRIFETLWAGGSANDWAKITAHLALHGIDARKDYGSPEEAIDACKNTEVLGHVVQEQVTNKTTGKVTTQNSISFFVSAE